ncbi:hypothetical protein LX36DRAFT_172458 [Colletotrichum falcatum]|nr:hypothetical protein LX36DRAFT_172458 [Colletotrichum falcatum]
MAFESRLTLGNWVGWFLGSGRLVCGEERSHRRGGYLWKTKGTRGRRSDWYKSFPLGEYVDPLPLVPGGWRSWSLRYLGRQAGATIVFQPASKASAKGHPAKTVGQRNPLRFRT